MSYSIPALALTTCLLLLGGCGQMGPLYLPEQEQAPEASETSTEENSGTAQDAS